MPNNDFAPYLKKDTVFIVKNINTENKAINIFTYPINPGDTRDLLQIPGVSEADIRASLLKGEIRHKLLAKDIFVTDSDIDLLQFNLDQKYFLKASGIKKGLQVDYNNINVLRKEDIVLNGLVDDVNQIFTIPSGYFIYNSIYRIIVYKNGVKQLINDDYYIAESGGPGTGYNTVILTIPPQTTPAPLDVITADYYMDNS